MNRVAISSMNDDNKRSHDDLNKVAMMIMSEVAKISNLLAGTPWNWLGVHHIHHGVVHGSRIKYWVDLVPLAPSALGKSSCDSSCRCLAGFQTYQWNINSNHISPSAGAV